MEHVLVTTVWHADPPDGTPAPPGAHRREDRRTMLTPAPITPGPFDNVQVGTILFTLVQPHAGHEVDYDRWYERDHFYAGCLIGKSWFAGGRWVAPRDLKALRFPSGSSFLPDLDAGSYLATYWVEKGRDAEAIEWGSEQVHWLHENGR